VSALCCVGQVHRNLSVLDTPSGAGVLTLHADRMHPLLDVAGFVNDQNRAGVAEGVDDIVTQIISNPVGVPFRRASRCCRPSGVASPRCSAIVQQFLRSGPETIPSINSLA